MEMSRPFRPSGMVDAARLRQPPTGSSQHEQQSIGPLQTQDFYTGESYILDSSLVLPCCMESSVALSIRRASQLSVFIIFTALMFNLCMSVYHI